MRFSQRIGITPSEKEIQIDSIDIDLLNKLWNIYKLSVLDQINTEFNHAFNVNPFKQFSTNLWHGFYKLPVDEIPSSEYRIKENIKNNFFKAEWHEVYDFIEFNVNMLRERVYGIKSETLEQRFNIVLEKEFSGFRFIQGLISPITNNSEINEIDEAMKESLKFTALNGCNIHLTEALKKLSDKKNPDYRNSIKESISAIESIAKKISNNDNDSLGAALDKIKGKIKIHSALERSFKQLYGYTSDTGGIRHALTEEPSCDFEDAKFMLVSCSAFVNYLIIKADKAKINF